MPARTPGNEIPHHPSESTHLEQTQAGVIGNERLTALVSFVLLVLIMVELVTSAVLRSWLPAHTFVGGFLAGPLPTAPGFARPRPGPARHHSGDDWQWDWARRDRPDPAVSSRACVQRAGLASADGCP